MELFYQPRVPLSSRLQQMEQQQRYLQSKRRQYEQRSSCASSSSSCLSHCSTLASAERQTDPTLQSCPRLATADIPLPLPPPLLSPNSIPLPDEQPSADGNAPHICCPPVSTDRSTVSLRETCGNQGEFNHQEHTQTPVLKCTQRKVQVPVTEQKRHGNGAQNSAKKTTSVSHKSLSLKMPRRTRKPASHADNSTVYKRLMQEVRSQSQLPANCALPTPEGRIEGLLDAARRVRRNRIFM